MKKLHVMYYTPYYGQSQWLAGSLICHYYVSSKNYVF